MVEIVLRIQFYRLSEIKLCHGIIVEIGVVSAQLVIHLRRQRVERKAMTEQVEGSGIMSGIILAQRLEIEILVFCAMNATDKRLRNLPAGRACRKSYGNCHSK